MSNPTKAKPRKSALPKAANRVFRVSVRFTQDEISPVIAVCKQTGLRWSELIRHRILKPCQCQKGGAR